MQPSTRRAASSSERSTARGADRQSSNTEDNVLTLNAPGFGAVDWLKEEVLWHQFGRKPKDGFGKLIRLRKGDGGGTSWATVLSWLQSSEHLNSAIEGTIRCELKRCSLKLFVQIHEFEIMFVLQSCDSKKLR